MRKTPDENASQPVCCYREAMRITGLKKTKLYDLFRRGTLRGYRDGAMIRFYRESLLTYMKERENIPAPPPAPARPARRPVKPRPGIRFKFL